MDLAHKPDKASEINVIDSAECPKWELLDLRLGLLLYESQQSLMIQVVLTQILVEYYGIELLLCIKNPHGF